MMVKVSSSETSVLTRASRRNIAEDAILHSHRRENLKSYNVTISCAYCSTCSVQPNCLAMRAVASRFGGLIGDVTVTAFIKRRRLGSSHLKGVEIRRYNAIQDRIWWCGLDRSDSG
jgi:hypothetical protein